MLDSTDPKLFRELVADHLEKLDPDKFDMYDWVSECGTQMCIAGWALHLAGYPRKKGRYFDIGEAFIEDAAARLLGLNGHEAHALFVDFTIDTPQEAAEKLRKLG